MIYLPDANAFSAYLSGKSPSLTTRMQAEFAAGSLRLSVMVMAELEFGAEKARRQRGTTRFIRRVESLRGPLEMELRDHSSPGITRRCATNWRLRDTRLAIETPSSRPTPCCSEPLS
jgi:hypothetical protein